MLKRTEAGEQEPELLDIEEDIEEEQEGEEAMVVLLL